MASGTIKGIGQVIEGIVASGTEFAITGSINLGAGTYIVTAYSGMSTAAATPLFAIKDSDGTVYNRAMQNGRQWNCTAVVKLSSSKTITFNYGGGNSITTTTTGLIQAVKIA